MNLTFSDDKPIILCGDHHGDYQAVISLLKKNQITDCYLIHVGDGGEGFTLNTEKQHREFAYYNDIFKHKNIVYCSIRGNHSNPYYFRSGLVNLDNFKLLEDYSTISYKNKTIQLIGGAVSIDRSIRKSGRDYWEDEVIEFDRAKCKKVDVLITHTAPTWSFPYGCTSDIVKMWCNRDSSLFKEIVHERLIMEEIVNCCEPSLLAYGHFHVSHIDKIRNCVCKALAINELWELRI